QRLLGQEESSLIMTTESCPPSKCKYIAIIIAAAMLALGPATAGYMVMTGLKQFNSTDNFVNVKELATRDVESDLVIWAIKHAATGDDLPAAQAIVEANSQKTLAFLKSQGLTDTDIVQRRIEVTDLLAQQYRSEGAQQSRYIVAETIVVRTN